MRTSLKLALFAGLLVLLRQAPCCSGETEVGVTKGKVEVANPQGSLTVNAGFRSVLRAGSAPTLDINDPFVKDVITMSKWITDERASSEPKVEVASAEVMELVGKDRLRMATYVALPNEGSKPSDAFRVGQMTIIPGIAFYDMEGRPIEARLEPVGGDSATENLGYYHLKFHDTVAPGDSFCWITVLETKSPDGLLTKEGKLWRYKWFNDSRHCLSYHKLILPESAILIGWTRPLAAIEAKDGRTAVTIRQITGYRAEWNVVVTFLWPSVDAVGYADVPHEYRVKPGSGSTGN